MRHANKSKTILFRSGEGSGKIIRNPYLSAHHHQKLIGSSDWYAKS